MGCKDAILATFHWNLQVVSEPDGELLDVGSGHIASFAEAVEGHHGRYSFMNGNAPARVLKQIV
jgi:hypothetical protein